MEVDKVPDMMMDMEVDKVVDMMMDMEVDKVADVVVNMEVEMVSGKGAARISRKCLNLQKILELHNSR